MQLTAPTRQAIAKAMEQGIHVTLATGRSFHSAKKYADRLKLDVPLICANGGMIAIGTVQLCQKPISIIRLSHLYWRKCKQRTSIFRSTTEMES